MSNTATPNGFSGGIKRWVAPIILILLFIVTLILGYFVYKTLVLKKNKQYLVNNSGKVPAESILALENNLRDKIKNLPVSDPLASEIKKNPRFGDDTNGDGIIFPNYSSLDVEGTKQAYRNFLLQYNDKVYQLQENKNLDLNNAIEMPLIVAHYTAVWCKSPAFDTNAKSSWNEVISGSRDVALAISSHGDDNKRDEIRKFISDFFDKEYLKACK